MVWEYAWQIQRKRNSKKKWFGTPKKATFENEEVNIPENSDAILKCIYGDYMKLPPEKDRVAHGVKILKYRNI